MTRRDPSGDDFSFRTWALWALIAVGVLFLLVFALSLIPRTAYPSSGPMPPNAVMIAADREAFSWGNIVSQTGFPIAVSIYLLWMLDKRLVKILEILGRITEIMRLRPHDEDDNQ